MISREFVPFAILKEIKDSGYKVFRDAYASTMGDEEADDLVNIFVRKNKALCDREMGWCVPHIGKVLSDFSDLDKEHPLNEKDLPGYDENIVFFFKEDEQNGCFSQWYHSPFVVEGIRYITAEQYMMAKKALLFKDYEIYDRIMKEKSPRKCKALGKKVQGFDNKIWDESKEDIIYKGNLEKFRQNTELLDILLSTGGEWLAEANPGDYIWGIALDKDDPRARNPRFWRGENLLGKALMRVRDELAFKYRVLEACDLGVHAGVDFMPDNYYVSEEHKRAMDKLLKMAVGVNKWMNEPIDFD